MTHPFLLVGAAALAWLAAAPASYAQTDPAALDLIERLRPQSGALTRGIRVPGAVESAPPAVVPVQPAPFDSQPAAIPAPSTAGPGAPVFSPDKPAGPAVAVARPPVRDTTSDAPSASITVNFASGAWTLTPQAERALAPLGRALSSQDLAAFRFRIEGHTDTVGNPESNRALSERRAMAVRDHLIARFGVNPARLEAIGLGETQLLVPTPDQSPNPSNRRVQVVNIGG